MISYISFLENVFKMHKAKRCVKTNSIHTFSLFPRSCRLAPLVQCDYCPLLFHMDCLDPPLTAYPTGRWMCPNHIQHLVVRKLCIAVLYSDLSHLGCDIYTQKIV